MIWRKDSVFGLAVLVEILLLDFSSVKSVTSLSVKILDVLHYFSGVLSFLLNAYEREVKAFATALSSASITRLWFEFSRHIETELGFTGGFIPAVIEISVEVSSDFTSLN